jgi:hypothetical protein
MGQATASALGLVTVRLLLAFVFAYAAVAKFRNGGVRSAGGLLEFLSLPPIASRAIALTVLCAEAILTVGIVAGIAPTVVGSASFGLLLLFSAVLLVARSRGYRGSCGCFGDVAGSRTSMEWLRNCSLMAAAAMLVAMHNVSGAPAMALWLVPPLLLLTAIAVTGALLVSFMVVTSMSEVARAMRSPRGF